MTEKPRQELEFSLTTIEKGDIKIKMYDRITVDDVFLHLVHRELFRLITKETIDDEINPLFKDFLVKPGFTMGQN